MRGRRLLERLASFESSPESRRGDDLPEVMASVQRHVAKLLNTRQGSVPLSPEYGIPDFTAVAGTFTPEAAPEVERAVARIVSRFEPRLRNVQVVYISPEQGSAVVQFRLTAKLHLENVETPVVFETVLRPDGRLEIKE